MTAVIAFLELLGKIVIGAFQICGKIIAASAVLLIYLWAVMCVVAAIPLGMLFGGIGLAAAFCAWLIVTGILKAVQKLCS